MPSTTAANRRALLANLSVADLAYIAGFVDGEGSITMEPRKHPKNGLRCRIPEVTASSVDREVIAWLHEVCGGSISTKRHSTRPSQKTLYCWVLRGESALGLTRLLLPYLRIDRRRRRAEKLITFKGSGWARTTRESEAMEAFAQELFAL